MYRSQSAQRMSTMEMMSSREANNSFECKDCGLTFQSAPQLTVHRQRFCSKRNVSNGSGDELDGLVNASTNVRPKSSRRESSDEQKQLAALRARFASNNADDMDILNDIENTIGMKPTLKTQNYVSSSGGGSSARTMISTRREASDPLASMRARFAQSNQADAEVLEQATAVISGNYGGSTTRRQFERGNLGRDRSTSGYVTTRDKDGLTSGRRTRRDPRDGQESGRDRSARYDDNPQDMHRLMNHLATSSGLNLLAQMQAQIMTVQNQNNANEREVNRKLLEQEMANLELRKEIETLKLRNNQLLMSMQQGGQMVMQAQPSQQQSAARGGRGGRARGRGRGGSSRGGLARGGGAAAGDRSPSLQTHQRQRSQVLGSGSSSLAPSRRGSAGHIETKSGSALAMKVAGEPVEEFHVQLARHQAAAQSYMGGANPQGPKNDGMFILFDYVDGIQDITNCRVVWEIYDGAHRLHSTDAIQKSATRAMQMSQTTNATKTAILGMKVNLHSLPRSTHLKIVLRLETMESLMSSSNGTTVAWSILPLFIEKKEEEAKESILEANYGLWKLSLFKAPAFAYLNANELYIEQKEQMLADQYVYVRLMNIEEGTTANAGGSPIMTHKQYSLLPAASAKPPLTDEEKEKQEQEEQTRKAAEELKKKKAADAEEDDEERDDVNCGLLLREAEYPGHYHFLRASIRVFSVVGDDGESSSEESDEEDEKKKKKKKKKQEGMSVKYHRNANKEIRWNSHSNRISNTGKDEVVEWMQKHMLSIAGEHTSDDLSEHLLIELFGSHVPHMHNKAVDLSKETLVGWTVVPMMGEDGQLNIGQHEMEMYAAPLAIEGLLRGDVAEESDEEESEDDEDRVARKKRNVGKIHNVPGFDVTLEVFGPGQVPQFTHLTSAQMSAVPFIPHAMEPASSTPYNFESKSNGFDIYIDAARYLPRNVTVSRCVLELRNLSSPDKVFVKEWEICDAEGTIYSPEYGLRFEVRSPVHPTTMIVITIGTLDALTFQYMHVGVSCLNLFTPVGSKDRSQPSLTPAEPCALNLGTHQLPLYTSFPEHPSTCSEYNSLSRVPGATLLCRIMPAPLSEDGSLLSTADVDEEDWDDLIVPAPKYYNKDGGPVYSNQTCKFASDELQLLKNLCYQPTLSVKESVASLVAGDSKIDPYNAQDASDWIFSSFAGWEKKQAAVNAAKVDFLNPLYPYHPKSGVAVAVDALLNAPGKAIPVAIATVLTKNTPYNTAMRQHGMFNQSLNWSSPSHAPTWNDGFVGMKNVPFYSNAVLIIEIRLYIPSNNDDTGMTFSPYGWSVVPLFRETDAIDDVHFVMEKSYQLPLYSGFPPSTVLQTLATSSQSVKQLLSEQKSNGLKLVPRSNILVRIIDGQKRTTGANRFPFGGAPPGNKIGALDLSYIPISLLSQYKYAAPALKPQTLAETIPGKEAPAIFEPKIRAQVSAVTGIIKK